MYINESQLTEAYLQGSSTFRKEVLCQLYAEINGLSFKDEERSDKLLALLYAVNSINPLAGDDGNLIDRNGMLNLLAEMARPYEQAYHFEKPVINRHVKCAPAASKDGESMVVEITDAFSQTTPAKSLAFQFMKSIGLDQNAFTQSGMSDAPVTSGGGNVTPPCVPVSIIQQPQSASPLAGETVTFTVAATSPSPITFQWFKNGAEIVGETTDTLVVPNVGTPQEGTYQVLLTNDCGFEFSAAAILAINCPKPVITTQPQPFTGAVGATVTLSVVSPTPGVTYQWKKNGTNVAGATGSSLVLNTAQVTDSGSYTVDVSNLCGPTTSNAAVVNISCQTPVITTQPSSVSKNVGEAASFTVAATGATGYQWRKNGVDIVGQTSATLNLANVQQADQATYTVVVINACGNTVSSAANLTINCATPSITGQPASTTITAGDNVSFTVAATSTQGALSYQWKKDGVNIAGANSATYTINAAAAGAAGAYSCAVTNNCGTVNSNGATLTVNTPLSFNTTIRVNVSQFPAAVAGITVQAGAVDPVMKFEFDSITPLVGLYSTMNIYVGGVQKMTVVYRNEYLTQGPRQWRFTDSNGTQYLGTAFVTGRKDF